jgi:putative transposase
MSGKGNCWDNSVAESFFGRLKQEQLMWTNLSKRYEGQQDTLNFITI